MNFPDPDKILESFERVKEAFARAAEADTGSAKRHFVRLSDKFNNLVEQGMKLSTQDLDPKKLTLRLMPTVMDLQMTLSAIKREAQNNPAAAAAINELEDTMRQEITTLMSALDGIPGLPKIPGLKFPPQAPKAPPAPPANSNKPAPKKKPGGGDFKL